MVDAGTHVFHVSLKPKLYRDIEIPSDNMLADLARSIIRSFGFDFDHPYGFYSLLKGNILRSQVKYELFADINDIGEPSDAGSVERTRIGDVFRRTGRKMTFLFDYGDNWEFFGRAGRAEREGAWGDVSPGRRESRESAGAVSQSGGGRRMRITRAVAERVQR